MIIVEDHPVNMKPPKLLPEKNWSEIRQSPGNGMRPRIFNAGTPRHVINGSGPLPGIDGLKLS